jgi:hypothetical protein
MKTEYHVFLLALALILSGCASGPPSVPYPAFIQADELPDVFIAGLPGIRAKQFAGNPQSRRTSNRLLLPAGWNGTTGASPGKSVELFVISGRVMLGSMILNAGGYAYIPPGFTGSNISTQSGAMALYFVDDPNPEAVIETPLILDSNLIEWRAVSDSAEHFGFAEKELRQDPGSGVRTWLLRIEPGALQGWTQSGTMIEGYLLSGIYSHSECVNGKVLTHQYTPGGYFARPPGAISGGPDSAAATSTIWYLRMMGKDSGRSIVACATEAP